MNDRELDIRVREAFDTLEVPDALRQRTLEAYDELAAAQAAEKRSCMSFPPPKPRHLVRPARSGVLVS